ncbi:MAG: HEAT repeat domain-containing protein [Deltaproteobacteria bacterium]|nr:HEAT repeat domain-containing protein [Deltaproteobacteria bacterium]
MNDWNNDDQSPSNPEVPVAPQVPQAPEAPPAIPPAAPPAGGGSFGMDDYSNVDVDEKISSGNKGVLIAFLILIVLGGVIGFMWFKDNSNYQKWNDKLQAALKIQDDSEYKAAMRDILLNCDREDILTQVAFELGEAKDAGAVSALTKAVEKGGELSQEAAMALAKINNDDAKTACDAIFNQMQKSEELRKAKFAWALVSLGDERGFPDLLEGVSKQIVNVKNIPGFSADLIARMATTEKLIELASAKDPMLKMYAAMELGFRDDKDPVPALLKLLDDPERKISEAAAISLGRTGDERAGKALLAKIATAPDMLSSILSSVTQSVGSPGLESIYKNTTDPAVKYQIIGKLKSLNDPRSADLLISITDEQFPGSDDKSKREADQLRNQALWTLETLGDKRIAEKMYAKTQWEPISEEAIPDPSVRYRQDDMSRKIANGVVTWFGTVKPDGASEYLKKIYEDNAPYSNTPECAKRVKVDIGPLMDSMGRVGDEQFCSIVKPFLTQDEGFYSQAASMALGRLKCSGIAADFKKMMVMTATERKEEKFSTLIESRDWQMESRLQERRNSIIASRYLEDPSLADTLMDIVMDPVDDPELREEAANSLAYVADDDAMVKIIEKVNDNSLDAPARAALIKGLWHKPSKAAVEAMMKLLEGEGNEQFIKPAAIVVGEAGLKEYEDRLNALLDSSDESRRRAAVMAILLGGNTDRLDRILEILEDQESLLVMRDWYQSHPVFVTEDIFNSKRIYKRLRIAQEIILKTEKTSNIVWPWKYLMERLEKGWDTSPRGLTELQVRQHLYQDVMNDSENGYLAAEILRGLDERGYLLALQSEKGQAAKISRDVLSAMNKTTI